MHSDKHKHAGTAQHLLNKCRYVASDSISKHQNLVTGVLVESFAKLNTRKQIIITVCITVRKLAGPRRESVNITIYRRYV